MPNSQMNEAAIEDGCHYNAERSWDCMAAEGFLKTTVRLWLKLYTASLWPLVDR